MSALYIPFKIDLYHREKNITFGPRFKGERGKDILAVKIALGILKPIQESENFESNISFDPDIPLDSQGWFDCATGLGTDIMRATLFDSSLENALLTYQINNTFLITSYLFYRTGIIEIMKSFDNPDSTFLTRRSLLAAGIDATLALFESELGTLGEATIAVMHGWTPSSRVENESYRHNSLIYGETDTVVSIVPEFLYESLNNLTYPQNFQALVEAGLAVPGSLQRGVSVLRLILAPSENWLLPASAESETDRPTDDNYGVLEFYSNLSGTSVLYKATTEVIDYYIENDLFSKTLSPEELTEVARSAIYPDPFSSEDPFIISNTKIGIYLSTKFELDPNNLPVNDEETILDLEEKALKIVLDYFKKPEVWNFFRQDPEFIGAYYSSILGTEEPPNHIGVFPRKITQRMIQKMEDFPPPFAASNSIPAFDSPEFVNYKISNFWSLSTKDVIDRISENSPLQGSVQTWRSVEGFGQTRPLIKFVKYITPTLRPGQKYRAYFEINKSKLDLIVDGDSLAEVPRTTTVPETSDPSACLDENTEQAQKSYEEYKAHAIARRREIVREIRERAQQRDLSRPVNVDLGSFGYLPGIQDFNFNGLSDYELTQKVIQSVVPTEFLEASLVEELNQLNELTTMSPGSSGTDSNNTDEDENSLTITYGDLKERVEAAAADLREAATVIKRESIRFIPGSGFNGENEALKLEQFADDLGKSLGTGTESVINIQFQKVETSTPGPQNGKLIKRITVDGFDASPFQTEANKRPRTVNYIANLKKMTSFPKITTFFRDARNSCQDLGIDVDKMTTFTYVSKYTSGLKIIVDKTDTSVFQSWIDSTEDKIKSTWTTTKSNMGASFDKSNFNSDAALRALGQKCTERDVYEQVYDKLSLPSLLCDYIKCVRLPPFDVKLPRLRFDPIPIVPIFGWLAGLDEFVQKQMEEIKTRLLCTLAKLLIDKLAFPFCEEQLADFINTSPQTLPEARQALIDSLISTGIVPGNEEKAKNFFDAAAGILTGRELCYLLEGNRPDNATMSAIRRLTETFEVSSDLDTDEKITNFFGVLGSFLPSDFCEEVGRSTSVAPTSCDDTNNYARAVRNRLMSGDSSLSEEEIENVVNQVEKEKQEEAEKLKKLLENGFSGMLPPPFEIGNLESPLSDYPSHIKNQLKKCATNFFSSARAAYTEDLAEYVPSLAVSSPTNIHVYDPRYNESETLLLEASVQQLQTLNEQIKYYSETFRGTALTVSYPLSAQYGDLHELYQTEIVEAISGRFVRQFLQNVEDGAVNVPHTTVKTTYFEAREQYFAREKDVPGVRVHKRRIKLDPENQNLDNQIAALDAIISRYDRRVSRTSGGKRDRLRDERRPYIRRRDALKRRQEDQDAENEPVSLEFYLAYQQRAQEANIPLDERLEFELVPFDNPLASTAKRYSDFDETDRTVYVDVPGYPHTVTPGGSGVGSVSTIVQTFVDETGYTTDNNDALTNKISNQLIQERINTLTNTIIEILQRTPTIVDDYILLGIQNMLESQTETNLERFGQQENVEQEGDSYKLEFNPDGSAYSPSITMIEYPAKHDKDRYDIVFSGDYYLGQLSKEEKITKKYCDQLPPLWEDSEVTAIEGTDESPLVFGKRIRFKNIIKESMKSKFGDAFNNTDYVNYLQEELFKKTTEGIFESLLDEISDSELFKGDYISLLDGRVAGKRTINETCVSNRYSIGAGSIISFDDVIMDDPSSEIGKELAKPENSPANSDFDSHSGLDKALQNLALKGLIRVCLIDTFLKGGLAYAVWDFEPISGEKITIDYILEHVKNQLNTSSDLKDMWPRVLERVTGISNQNVALEYFVKQEIVKLPNYSKQIFNPFESETNFYNWFFEEGPPTFIPRFDISSIYGNVENNDVLEGGTWKIGSLRMDEGYHIFKESKPSFFTEEYVIFKIVGETSSDFKDYLSEKRYLANQDEYLLSVFEFSNFLNDLPYITRDNPSTYDQFNEFFTGVEIFHGARICILDNIIDNQSDSRVLKQKQFLKEAYSNQDIISKSNSSKTFLVRVNIETLDEASNDFRIKEIDAFSIPLTKFERKMDFEECYRVLAEGEAAPPPRDLGDPDYDYSWERVGTVAIRELRKAGPFIYRKLYETKEAKILFENIFPIRRLMSIVSVYATSIVSGYSGMPNLLTSTKNALIEDIRLSNLTRNQKAEVPILSQEEFAKQLLENFPTSEDSCLEFPDLFSDFWEKMIKDLIKLIKKMPSILLRGIANQLDPAYQEMRQHYMNCDIKNLTYRGLRPAGTVDYKLTNGLYLKGRNRGENTSVEGLEGKGNGKYVPLFLGTLSDAGYALSSFPNMKKLGERLGITLLKLTTYMYSGNAPFLDPAMHFKVPCADTNVGAWRDKGKYDAGAFGRYGHPLTPFTYMALATPQLESDKRQRENVCRENIPKDDCEDIQQVPDEVVAIADAPPPLTPEEEAQAALDAARAEEEAQQRAAYAADRLSEEAEAELNRMSPQERAAAIELGSEEVDLQEGTSAAGLGPADPDACDQIRVRLRMKLKEKSSSFNNDGSMKTFQQRNTENAFINGYKAQLMNEGCTGAPTGTYWDPEAGESGNGARVEYNANDVKDFVTVVLISESTGQEIESRTVVIPFETKAYGPMEIQGMYFVYSREEYENFGK